MGVVCAPNAFKGTLDARAAAGAMARGVRDAGAVAIEVPMADGGDGTLDVLLAAAGSEATVSHHRVTGSLGAPVRARLGGLGGGVAVVELAAASGLRLVDARSLDALAATSRGTGELIRIALDAGATRIVVGVGGSACTDGGAGLLQALGARLTDDRGADIGPGGAGLERLATIDLGGLHPRLAACVLEVASDVRNPLLGREGAAAVFAPQKGASPAEVARLEAALAHLVSIATAQHAPPRLAEAPGSGAAGGCGYALALVGARLLDGAELVAGIAGLDRALDGAVLALTGEGRLDSQTASGKAPGEVAVRAGRRGVPCAAIAGSVLDPLPGLFTAAISLQELAGGEDPRRHTRALLRRAAALLTRRLLGESVSRPG